ncbi:MAG: hypothetical protein ABSB25_04385 [Sedimentisphaerales bacterium]|jgi:hypothetical protein
MAEKDIQADDFKTPRRPDILRAKDIIPGAAGPAGKGDGVSNTDIPRFDLAEDIMSEHRRLTAGRRKGPGGSTLADLTPVPPPSVKKPFLSRYGFSEGFNAAGDPVIADIVARDIERLCRGLRA